MGTKYALGFDRRFSVIKRLKKLCNEKGINTLITELDGFETLILLNNDGKWLGGAVNTEKSSLTLAGHYLQLVGIKTKKANGKTEDITDLLVQDDVFRVFEYCYLNNTSVFCGELPVKEQWGNDEE